MPQQPGQQGYQQQGQAYQQGSYQQQANQGYQQAGSWQQQAGQAYQPGQTAQQQTYQQATQQQATQQRAYQQQANQQQNYQQPTAQPVTPAPAGPDKGKKKAPKPFILGLLGGVIGALVLVLVLKATGVIGGTQIIKTTDSSAGQTINITSNSEDATTAQAAAAKALPSVVSVHVVTSDGEGLGSGVILDTDGNIITNYHVIDGATSISVTIDGTSYDASVVGSDASSDLAVIKVDLGDTTVTPIEVADSDSLVVGDWVMSVGSPFGLDQSVSAGIVSALTRNQLMQSTSGNTLYTNLIQTDAAINPGNSGGALVDDEGKLVGICTLYSSSTESSASVGFAIPSNYAIDVANKIIAGETVTHAYIGLTMQTVNAQNALSNSLSVSQGAYVTDVTSGSPADQAGIQKGDIIIAVNGEDITSADGMILNVRSHSIGETVAVTFMRGSEEKTVNVTLGSDEELQKEQEQQQQQQNTNSNGYGYNDQQQDYEQQLYDYLFNNRGGSYDESDQTTGTAA